MGHRAKLAGKVALVTGGGSKPYEGNTVRVGRAIATLFAEEDASVVVVDWNEERANEARRLIEEAGGKAATVVADLADEASCVRVVEEAVAAFGRLDILVNNVSAYAPKGLLETSFQDIQHSITVNLTVPFLLSKAAIPVMVDGGGGSIVNISSISAVAGVGPAAYAAPKAGLSGLTASVANEFGTMGVRMNTIVIGGITAAPSPQAETAPAGGRSGTRTVFGIAGDSWDVARTALFLASDDSRHVTGVSLRVDGGATIILAPMPAAVRTRPSAALAKSS